MQRIRSDFQPELITSIPSKESDYLFVQTSLIPNAGKGLFTAIKIYRYEVIAMFRGRILNDRMIRQRELEQQDDYFISMTDGTTMDCLDAKGYAKYANDAHGNSKNIFQNNSIITLNAEDAVCLVALKNIMAGSEIYCSYGKQYWDHRRNRQ